MSSPITEYHRLNCKHLLSLFGSVMSNVVACKYRVVQGLKVPCQLAEAANAHPICRSSTKLTELSKNFLHNIMNIYRCGSIPADGTFSLLECADPALALQLDDEDDAVHQRGQRQQHEAEAHAEVGRGGLCLRRFQCFIKSSN